MAELRYPIKLDDDYPCRGVDAAGEHVVFDDLLQEGNRVGCRTRGDDVFGPYGIVVQREDGLQVEVEIGPGDVQAGRVMARAIQQAAA